MDISAARPTLFLRKASGITKNFSPVDMLIYNFMAVGVVAFGAIPYMQSAGVYPRGNIILGLVIAAIVTTFAVVAYAMLMAALPRSGGDYVFQSRILGGAIAVTTSLCNYLFGAALAIAVHGWMFAAMIMAPFFTVAGAYWGIQPISDLGAWLVTPLGIFVATIVLTIWDICIGAAGLRRFAKVQRWCTYVGLTGAVVMLVWLAFSTQTDFIAGFNNFMAQYFGTPDAYQTVLANAKMAGFDGNLAFDWGQTLRLIPIMMFITIWALWGNPLGGEIRDAARVKHRLIQMGGALWLSIALAVVIIIAIQARFGLEFLSSSAYLYFNAPDQSPLPVPPFFGFLAMAMSNNPVLIVATFLAFLAWFWVISPNNTISGPRPLYAMSMDRVAPGWLGRIDTRTHSPLNAIILIGVVTVIFAWLYDFTGFGKFTLAFTILAVIMFAVTCLAAAIWPYVKPELFNSTPAARYKIGGVPVITICGLLFLPPAGYISWAALTVPELGMMSVEGWLTNLGLFVLGAIVYYSFKIYRKRSQALDISMVYREIPPE